MKKKAPKDVMKVKKMNGQVWYYIKDGTSKLWVTTQEYLHRKHPYPACVDHSCEIHPWVL